jgi:hypothetical protein
LVLWSRYGSSVLWPSTMSAIWPLRSGTWSSVRRPPRLVIFATSPLRLVRFYRSTDSLLPWSCRTRRG